MTLADKLGKKALRQPQGPAGPVWLGPSAAGDNGGITFSMLSRFLTCRERFRVRYVEGLKPADAFSHRIEYGQMWHACEEALAAGPPARWENALGAYTDSLGTKYPLAREQILHWYNVCKVQFPVYVEHWKKHQDVVDRRPLLQEQPFDVPYRLPSGRTVRLRGKWDAVDLIGRGKGAGVYLQENKTKGDVDPEQIRRQLTFDLQTMMYLVALHAYEHLPAGVPVGPILGVRYNVVRRPLSGGKGTISRHKPTKSNPGGESAAEFYARLRGIIGEDPGHYFVRFKAEVSAADVARFRRETLDPILEQLCDWYSYIEYCVEMGKDPNATDRSGNVIGAVVHYRHPFGCVNTIDEYGHSDVDEYINTGSKVGLAYSATLFEELRP